MSFWDSKSIPELHTLSLAIICPPDWLLLLTPRYTNLYFLKLLLIWITTKSMVNIIVFNITLCVCSRNVWVVCDILPFLVLWADLLSYLSMSPPPTHTPGLPADINSQSNGLKQLCNPLYSDVVSFPVGDKYRRQMHILCLLFRCGMLDYREILLSGVPCTSGRLMLCWLQTK